MELLKKTNKNYLDLANGSGEERSILDYAKFILKNSHYSTMYKFDGQTHLGSL